MVPRRGVPWVLMHVLRLECGAGEKDWLVAELYERGTNGIVEEDLPGGRYRLEAYFEAPFETGAMGGHWEPAPERDWVEVARAPWEPALVGERFFLVPEWRGEAAPPGRIRLEMQPRMVCGSGWGPATRLALEAMERVPVAGHAVLDLGTGSGILAVAAARLGATRVWACDIEFEAAAAAATRCRRERVSVGVFCGSARALRDDTVELVVANINAEALTSLAEEIRRVLTPGGALILTGFPDRHLARIAAAFGPPKDLLSRDLWRAVIC